MEFSTEPQCSLYMSPLVATTFAADTPNLVTEIVRKNGVAGNWVWWAFLLTGMLTRISLKNHKILDT